MATTTDYLNNLIKDKNDYETLSKDKISTQLEDNETFTTINEKNNVTLDEIINDLSSLAHVHNFIYKSFNPEEYKETWECDCGLTQEKDHIHSYTIHLTDQDDDEYEVWQDPICGETTNIRHNFEFGDYGNCVNSGCNYYIAEPERHVHNPEEQIIKPKRPTAEYCYEVVITCKDCGEEISRQKYAHNLDRDNPYEEKDFFEYYCQNDSCRYSEVVYKEMNVNEVNSSNSEETIEIKGQQYVLTKDKNKADDTQKEES